MADKNTELVALQAPPRDVQPSVTRRETDLLLPPTSIYERLRHFPDNVYDLSPESKLVKFLKVLLGDAGAGQLRKQLLIQRMQSTLQGSHFYDLDRFYGPLFGLKRSVTELLDFNPYLQTATREQWEEAHAKDASFRSRIEQFARALTYGATPTGMELIAEALLSVDVDVYESYTKADASFQTYEELEDQYAGNILSDNASSIESDGTDWAAGSNTVVSRSTAWAFPDGFTAGGGIASLELMPVGGGDMSAETEAPAQMGEEYTFALVAHLLHESALVSPVDSLGDSLGDLLERNVRAEIWWYSDSSPSDDSLGDSVGDGISISVGDWVQVTEGVPAPVFVTDTAPMGAEWAVLRVVVQDATGEEVVFVDRVEFSLSEETYAGMEGVSYGDLEGLSLPRLSGDERRTFEIRPKRAITLAESYDLARVLYRLKPADSRFTINHRGSNVYTEVPIDGAWSDSEHWEIVPKVASAALAINPYQNLSDEPVEQPRPPFAGYQGEAWSYVTDLAGVSASVFTPGGQGFPEQIAVMDPVGVTYADGTRSEFPADLAILPSRMIQAGRLVSDAILITYPYTTDRGSSQGIVVTENTQDAVARLYIDGIPLDRFNEVLNSLPDVDPFQQNPQHRYWVTPSRLKNDTTEERLEVRLPRNSLINYITFEVARYPHQGVVEVRDSESAEWIEVMRWDITDSSPKVLPPGHETLMREGHPHHNYPNHWQRISQKFDAPVVFSATGEGTRRVRLRLRRTDGTAPLRSPKSEVEVPYSLAVRGFDVGYRVRSRSDFDFLDTPVIGTTNDIFGSQVSFEVVEQKAERVLDGELTAWRSEPQPVNYGVVNLYLDTRGSGDGSVIDRFFLDPTHDGAHFTIYYSMDPQEPAGDQAMSDFMAERTWTPLPRDFTLHKGYVHIPPTRARWWKFEFTGLTAESYENFLPINRRVKLFPKSIVDALLAGHGHAVEALQPGMNAAISVADTQRYRDAVQTLASFKPEDYRPTEAMYISDLNTQLKVKDKSWVFGFTPWHASDRAPRFQSRGQHIYDEVEVQHSTKVAFFVGLRTLKAYRTNFEADDDPVVYFDTFDDFRNLTPGFTMAFNPSYLTTSGASIPAEAVSRTFLSRSNIKAIQFATEQSNPVQLVPDAEFRNPALSSYDWNDNDDYTRVGDATLIYSPTDYSVINIRYVVPPPKPLSPTGGLVQGIHKPVFSYRPFEVADEAAAAATEGGMRTPLLGLSAGGRAYAAVRFTMLTEQSSPLILRLIDMDENVVAEKSIEALRGQLVEEYLGYDIPGPNSSVRVSLTQEGKSNDTWKVFSLSLFDESIKWEFSVNGGGDWYEAKEIRNNDNGILTFPAPGNQLRYRVTAYRDNLWISAIKIRPHYLGAGNARANGTHRGPNVSFYDQDVPIHDDPMFTAWKKPIPFYWYALSRRFPILAVEGAPVKSEFARFYGRPISIDLSGDEPEISLSYTTKRVRGWEERLDFQGPNVSIARQGEFNRSVGISVGEPTASIDWTPISGIEGGIIHPFVDPVFSEDKEGDDSPGDSI